MESDMKISTITPSNKTSLEKLSREELLEKYRGVLVIAKKAKQAKDEFTEENRKLRDQLQQYMKGKENDDNSIKAMREMLEAYTEQKLQLTNEINYIQKKRQNDVERSEKLSIENESMKRQLQRLTDDNEELLVELQRMEQKLQAIDANSKEEGQCVVLAEEKVNQLKAFEIRNAELLHLNSETNRTLDDLRDKYKSVKELYSGQKEKIHILKDRLAEVHRKLKTLKESKRILLETQHEYADSITLWQQEIIEASKRLFMEIQTLKETNKLLQEEQQQQRGTKDMVMDEMDNQDVIESGNSSKNEEENTKDVKFEGKSVEELTHINEQLEEERRKLQGKIGHLMDALRDSDGTISRLESENDGFKKQIQENELKCDRLQESLEDDHRIKQNEIHLLNMLVESIRSDRQQGKKNTNGLQEDQMKVLITEVKKINANNYILPEGKISNSIDAEKRDNHSEEFLTYYNELRALIIDLEDQLHQQVNLNKTLNEKVKELGEKCERIQAKDVSTNINESRIDLDEVASLKSQLAEIKVENQKLKSTRKQTNVLNLEIEAAERSLKEVSSKLSTRTSELKEAQELLKVHEDTIKQLQEEIQKIVISKTNLETDSKQLKEQNHQLEDTVQKLKNDNEHEATRSNNLEAEIETIKNNLESVRSDLRCVVKQGEEELQNQKKNNEILKQKLSERQEILSEIEQRLKEAQCTIEDQRKEFADYKIKAQTVLKKNQIRDTVRERELEEEIANLRQNEEQLKSNMELVKDKRQQLERQYNVMNENNLSLQRRTTELSEIIDDLRQQNDCLTMEVQKQQQHQHEMVKQHRLQIEMINSCQKEQLEMLKDTQQKQLEQLRYEQKCSALTVNRMENNHAPFVDVTLMAREDAEGSCEGVVVGSNSSKSRKISGTSMSSSNKHDLLPLDELLDMPLNSERFQDLESLSLNGLEQDNSEESFAYLQRKFIQTKDNLQKQETRVRHLSALLAENEQDLAKLSQMNEMLKEELRRHERCKEREQHMLNSEYMKNIILKFLTLNVGDERSRLVPVLNTLLKLTRSETELLTQVAKGQKVSMDSATRSSWSSFLNPW